MQRGNRREDRGRGGWGPPGHRHHGRHQRGATRCRWWDDEIEAWAVQARVERLVEPALLLLLLGRETHGYELAEALESLLPDERIDLGNLYRLLRALEEEGLVTSTWRDDLPGRSKRTYRLTAEGERALDAWAAALRRTQVTITDFLDRYDHERGRGPGGDT